MDFRGIILTLLGIILGSFNGIVAKLGRSKLKFSKWKNKYRSMPTHACNINAHRDHLMLHNYNEI